MLPAVEKSPVLLLRWTDKASKSDVIPMVKKELEKGGIIVRPNKADDTLLLTATQKALEIQAEREKLVKTRKISPEEYIKDHFRVALREEFRRESSPWHDPHGLFSVHERNHLVMNLLEHIDITDDLLKKKLVENHRKARTSSLRYILQSHHWIDVLTPLHVEDQKIQIYKETWYPLRKIMPPVENIQAYYGPTIAFYFGFMGFLAQFLGCLGFLGLLSFLFRLYREDTIDEDEYTPFYGLFCFVWAVLLVRFWDRQENLLAYQFGTLDLTDMADDFESDYSLQGVDMEHRRPEFEGIMRLSPVTGLPQFHYPHWKRQLRYLVSALVTTGMLSIAFFIMILFLNLQGYIHPRNRYHPFHFPWFAMRAEDGQVFDANSNWRFVIPVVLHAICIFTLNTIYKGIAKKLTDWENHATKRSHENSLILKRFLFEAFDCYIVLFYLAFFERDVDRLRLELVAVFNIDSFRRIFMEVVFPAVLQSQGEVDEIHPHDLHLDEYESFDDYMEILIQFGYVTLFASAYPLASLAMFVAVLVEIRSDMYRLTFLCQKPTACRAKDIGMWKSLLRFMVWFGCLTNCLLFGFTSDQMMQYMPDLYIHEDDGETRLVRDKGWVAILIIFGLERSLIYLGLVLQATIPELPESLVNQLKRRKYLLYLEDRKKIR